MIIAVRKTNMNLTTISFAGHSNRDIDLCFNATTKALQSYMEKHGLDLVAGKSTLELAQQQQLSIVRLNVSSTLQC